MSSGPVTIEISGQQRRMFSVAWPVSLAVGVVLAGVLIMVDGTTARVVIGVFALVALAFAGMSIMGWRQAERARVLLLDDTGLRWEEVQPERCWQVSWGELAGVRLTVLTVPSADGRTSRTYRLVDVFPATAGFRQRHPALERYWESDGVAGGYRLPKDFRVDACRELERVVRRTRPEIFESVEARGEPQDRPTGLYSD